LDNLRTLIEKIGKVPLPPYVKRDADQDDQTRYQTVYARNNGAVAAPTAGLHFTESCLSRLKAKGVGIEFITLHVGYGTFKPVEDLEHHRIHPEEFEMSPETAARLNRAKAEHRGIWAVGTTSLRVLETCVQNGQIIPGRGQTDLYIREPFTFEAADHLITNFHLPKTTLLLLVSAFSGEPLRKKAYAHAIKESYRFYSYGDAMLII
jgi:S-adenosylmethionine:tRNA ribosyltransferase-isomerase